jgi:hypothetical protein
VTARARAARQVVDLAQSEADFQTAVVQLATTCGFMVNHTRRARVRGGRVATPTSVDGWPDLEILGHGRIIYVECKAERGTLSAAQRHVLDELERAGLDVRVWRPRDWPSIEATLNPRGAR